MGLLGVNSARGRPLGMYIFEKMAKISWTVKKFTPETPKKPLISRQVLVRFKPKFVHALLQQRWAILMSTCGTLRAPGKEILADKVEKCAFLPFLGPLFAHISSHSGIWEKLPSTRFTYSPIPGHMPNFRKIVWLKLWDLVEFCTFRWASNSSRSSRGPTHSSMQKHVEKTRPPRTAGVGLKVFGIRRRRACLGMPTDDVRWCMLWGVGLKFEQR